MKRLWHLMLATAVIAGLFAAFGVIGTTATLIVFSALVLPLVFARPGSRLRAAAWVASLYPLLIVASLYATWLTAWIALGHRPRMSLDDPKFISPTVDVPFTATYLMMFGLPCATVCFTLIVLTFVGQSVGRNRIRTIDAVGRLLVLVMLWLSPFVVSRSGFFELDYILEWFMD